MGRLPALPTHRWLEGGCWAQPVPALCLDIASRTWSGVEAIKVSFHPALLSLWCTGGDLLVPWRTGSCPVLLCSTEGQEDAPGWAQPVPARLPHHVLQPLRLPGASLAPCPCHGANSSLWGPKPSQGWRDTEPSEVGAGAGGPTPGRLLTPRKEPGVRDQSRKREPSAAVGPGEPGEGLLGSSRRGAGAPRGPGPTMHALGQLLLVLVVGSAGGRGDPRDTLACSQGLTCRLLDTDVLCGTEPPGPRHELALARLRLEPALRCTEPTACAPCLEARVRLALPPATSTATESRLSVQPGTSGTEDSGDGGQWSPATGATPSQPNVTGLLLLSGHTYASSRCVAVEVWAPLGPALRGRTVGWVIFRCFEAPLGSDLHIRAYMNSRGRQRLSRQQRVPDCSWPAAQAAVPQCQVPRLRVSPGQKEVVVEVEGAAVGHSYTLRLYYNHSHGTSGPGRVVTMQSSPMNYVLPANEVLPCLCLQVWPETQDPLRATLCPFSHDAEAWERLWAQSQLVLQIEGQVLTCSLSASCDLLAELVPCWQPVPSGPCQPLPGLQQPARGKGPQEFGGLRPHPNLCVQVWSGGQIRLTQCLQDRALPGHPNDLLLLERGGNASLCAMERGACTPLANFTSRGAGHPGLLEQDLQQDVAVGQCQQLWHPLNGTGVVLWACPLHKYLRTHWALVWMGVLLGAACLLLLLLMKKEDMKGWLKSLRAGYGSNDPLQGRRALLVHAAEPVAERAACALMAALHSLGLTVVAAPGGGSGVAALGPLPWLHAQHLRALRDSDTIILLLSPAAVAAAQQWDAGARVVPESGGAESSLGPRHNPDPGDVPTVAPCEVFAAALSCTMPLLAVAHGHYVVARLEALVPAVPPALRAAPAFALPSEVERFLQALAGPARQRHRCLEPYIVAVAEALQRAVGE
ncbi:LOW QUALITY PROTEIN: interleukin-17 receptor C [Haemorhous mexicanus]|uniref:LOW QUALITY PROTEIN: interleukin-17 receptor C n=1 Tax=Haemorhous mexicanus TaxID=30427 RepID=UPI0028BDC8FF|nr:LOW QUALITY PROTEIN: interleukin-17 receptor C [Haemorhous mexicanus]